MEITKSCQNCGEVKFYLTPKVGQYEVKCSKCGTFVGQIELDKYETIINSCESCNNELFKARIKKDGESESWNLECIECKNPPKKKYVDNNLCDIDEKSREILILNDTIDSLNSRIQYLQEQLLAVSYIVENLELKEEGFTFRKKR